MSSARDESLALSCWRSGGACTCTPAKADGVNWSASAEGVCLTAAWYLHLLHLGEDVCDGAVHLVLVLVHHLDERSVDEDHVPRLHRLG